MSCSQAFQALRSSSRSFAARHVARNVPQSAANHRVARVRHYSAESAGSSGESKKEELRAEETEKDEVVVTPEHELLEKFKQKEAEVADLKVCAYVRLCI